MKNIAKNSKSLLNQTSKKSKKENKYSETSDIKKEYKFDINDNVFYLGYKTDFRNLECSIVKRSTKKGVHHYTIKFEEREEELDSVIVDFLKTPEEYEIYLLEQEQGSDNQENLSEMEFEMIKNGIESYKNYDQCLSPMDFYKRNCSDGCTYSSRCVYIGKFKYKNLD